MTIPTLRPYQTQLKADIYSAWASGARNVLAVAATGSGKTTVFADIMRETQGATVAIAHRQELVTQMSLALARNGVRHRVIGQPATIRMCVQLHMLDLGLSYYSASASAAVAGVDTLIRTTPDQWHRNVSLWICDEAHHLLRENKWGTAAEMFPNARGLGVTATPLRADGKGLGRHADGMFDVMVQAPGMRDLIDLNHLSDYRIFVPPSDLNLTGVTTTAGGDFSPEPLRAAVHGSHIHGDVVSHYLKVAPGKLGLTFAVDVESAVELAAAFRAVGVPAEALSGKTPDNIRYKVLQQLARGDIKQVCSCDILGEGLDLPMVETVSMARPTQSYGLFVQQFGRGVRLKPDGGGAIILDHVGNVLRHGLPDAPRVWTLDRRERRTSNSTETTIPVRICPSCTGAYERVRTACPYCGHVAEPVGRALPEQVDGSLVQLTPEVLAQMRGAIAHSEELRIPYGATPAIEGHLRKVHRERLAAQLALREVMMRWGGHWTAHGDTLDEAQRRFYLTFAKMDVATAQTLNATDADNLRAQIERNLNGLSV